MYGENVQFMLCDDQETTAYWDLALYLKEMIKLSDDDGFRPQSALFLWFTSNLVDAWGKDN